MKRSALTLLSIFLMIWMSGCTSQPKTPLQSKNDSTVPPVPTPLWLGDITAIALEWEPNHDPAVAGYTIYKKLKNTTDEFELIAQIEDRFTSHYIDLNLPSNTKYLYRVNAYDKNGVESMPQKPASTITRPTLQSVSYITALDRLPRKVKLIWRPHSNGRVNGYILERKQPDEHSWDEIETFDHRLVAEYIDDQLDDNTVYQYRLISTTFDDILSTPSDIVSVHTKALPEPITEMEATTDLPNEIRLKWHKHPQKDISHYNLYRTDSLNSRFVLHAKVTDTNFSDKIEEHGRTYFYQIAAVDFDGLEAERIKSWSGKSLERPASPKIITASINKDTVNLSWEAGDKRTQSFKLIQHIKEGWFNTKKSTISIDKNSTYSGTIPPNVGVYYEIIGTDKFNIDSLPTKSKEFLFEKVVE